MSLKTFIFNSKQYRLRAIPEKNTWGGGGRRQAIYFSMGGWCGNFQIIWVIGVGPNLITWVVGVLLRGRGRKNIICQKR